MHATKKLAFLSKQQVKVRKAATVMGIISLVVGLAAAGAMRVQLGKAASAINKAGGAKASLGSGFLQFWAGYALLAVADVLLVVEAFTSRRKECTS
ncbi:hypothetical protein BJY59DRAFT_694247 [Rhodotorula toruloides]